MMFSLSRMLSRVRASPVSASVATLVGVGDAPASGTAATGSGGAGGAAAGSGGGGGACCS